MRPYGGLAGELLLALGAALDAFAPLAGCTGAGDLAAAELGVVAGGVVTGWE